MSIFREEGYVVYNKQTERYYSSVGWVVRAIDAKIYSDYEAAVESMLRRVNRLDLEVVSVKLEVKNNECD